VERVAHHLSITRLEDVQRQVDVGKENDVGQGENRNYVRQRIHVYLLRRPAAASSADALRRTRSIANSARNRSPRPAARATPSHPERDVSSSSDSARRR